jgi:putative transcriptional regulator
MGKLYRSRIIAAIHETVEDLRGAGLVARRTMRGFYAACLMSVRRLSAEEIRMRTKLAVMRLRQSRNGA